MLSQIVGQRVKNVEKSHFSEFIRAPNDSPQANRGTASEKCLKISFFGLSPNININTEAQRYRVLIILCFSVSLCCIYMEASDDSL